LAAATGYIFKITDKSQAASNAVFIGSAETKNNTCSGPKRLQTKQWQTTVTVPASTLKIPAYYQAVKSKE
jgi:hypothetical protein